MTRAARAQTPPQVPDPQPLIDAETRRLSSLRTQMLEAHPFWGYLLLQVKLVPALELPTFAATDCVRHVWYNPLYTQHLSVAQLGFVLAHEVCHQVLASEDRRRGREHHLWNCATDYAINRIVAAIPRPGAPHEPMYASPDGAYPGLGHIEILDDERFDGLIAENVYERLAASAVPEPRSIAVSLADRNLPNVLDHQGGVDLHLPDLLGPRAREELRERIAGAVETWRSMGERGHAPAEFTDADPLERGRVPWQRVFRQHLAQALAQDDYALTRPNRRYLAHDVVVPGLYSERIGHVVVALDTSGSMTPDNLAAVAGEIEHLAREADDATLIVADSEVREVVGLEDFPRYLARRRFRGGGGTDHRPVFDYLRQRGLAPDVFVGLTDLETIFPDRRPSFPVIWVVTPDHGEAPWGSTVEVR